MNRHSAFRQSIAVYRDLDAGERSRVDEHLRVCPQCAAYFAQAQQVDGLLGALAQIPAPAQRVDALPAAPTAHGRASNTGRAGLTTTLGRSLGPAFAAIVLVAGLWVALASVNSSRSVATATPTQTLTPTPTVALGTVEAALQVGARGAGSGPVFGAPRPAPAPPQHGLAAASPPDRAFFVAHVPRATIVR